MECSGLLKEIYEDKDGQRKKEVDLLSGPNEFVEFYNRLKQIKEFYKKHPNEVVLYMKTANELWNNHYITKIAIPMSMEFEDYAKQRENGADETTSKLSCLFI